MMPWVSPTTARRLGLVHLTDLTAAKPLVRTRHGHPAAVVCSAAWADGDLRTLPEVALTVLDASAFLVAQCSPRHTLGTARERLGVDAAVVRRRATQLAED